MDKKDDWDFIGLITLLYGSFWCIYTAFTGLLKETSTLVIVPPVTNIEGVVWQLPISIPHILDFAFVFFILWGWFWFAANFKPESENNEFGRPKASEYCTIGIIFGIIGVFIMGVLGWIACILFGIFGSVTLFLRGRHRRFTYGKGFEGWEFIDSAYASTNFCFFYALVIGTFLDNASGNCHRVNHLYSPVHCPGDTFGP